MNFLLHIPLIYYIGEGGERGYELPTSHALNS